MQHFFTLSVLGMFYNVVLKLCLFIIYSCTGKNYRKTATKNTLSLSSSSLKTAEKGNNLMSSNSHMWKSKVYLSPSIRRDQLKKC